jgi:hypothetical protein
MDKRLTAAGYEIKAVFTSGSLPSSLYVTLNGEELPGSRQPLPAGAGGAAFLAAERDAFDDAEQWAAEHWSDAVLAGDAIARQDAARHQAEKLDAAPAGWAPFPAELTARGGEQGDGPDPFCGDCQGRGCPVCREAAAMGLPGHADTKDATIAALAAEVERLAGDLSLLGAGHHLGQEPMDTSRTAASSADLARTLLRRLGLTLAAGLLASGLYAAPAQAGPQAPARAPRHVTHPISSISVKVMPHAAFQGRFRAVSGLFWGITTADADSCVAWVDGGAPGIEAAELAAFKGCRAAVDRAVDAAHAAAEQGGGK